MQEVQKKHVALSETLDRGLEEPKNFEARERSRELEQALQNPTIAGVDGFRNEAEYQYLLREALAAVRQVRAKALKFDSTETWQTRDGISRSCQNCHDRFRSRPVARIR